MMKKLVLGALAAVAALSVAGVASAQPYGYRSGGYYDGYRGDRGDYRRDYRYDRRHRDSDRDGIPDYREWNRDRDRDGRPDQWDRYDNRRHHRGWDRGHDRYDRYDRRGDYGYRW
jgi:hypothetical protein